MYQLLVDIHNYKQLIKISRQQMLSLMSDLDVIARLVGADYRDIGQGRSLVGFQIHRPSDTAFVVDSVFRIYDFLIERRKDHAGFSMILESGNNDEEGERQIRQLLICAVENECLWFGPQAAAALAHYVYLETRGGLWKALSRNSSHTPDLNITQDLLTRFNPSDDIEAILDRWQKKPPKELTSLVVAGEQSDAVGDLVNDIITRRLGNEFARSFLWLHGQNQTDPAPIALTRTLFSIPENHVTDHLDAEEQLRWMQVRSFMFQNAHSSIPEIPPAGISLEFPLELFRSAWELYLVAISRQMLEHQKPYYIHVENFSLFNSDSRKLIEETIQFCRAITGLKVVVIYSACELIDLVQSGENFETVTINPFSWEELGAIGLPAESLPAALSFCRSLHAVSRRQAANLGFLALRMVGQTESTSEEMPTYSQQGQIERALLHFLFQSCDELAREVYYAIVITYGLLPVSLLFDFLSFMAVERIRHPAIIQNLYRHGLIRDEELVVPSFPNCAEILELALDTRAVRIRSDLENFLSNRLAKGKLTFRLDVFILMAEIANPDHFFEICFFFAQELLNVNNIETASYVLDYASTHLRNLADSSQKTRLIHAVSYLNCRSLLLQNRQNELQLAFTHLNQLPELTGQSISAYVQLQKARVHFFQSDIDQALIVVKRAVMQFQDAGDRTGLAASQILFGQILLAKERLIEARDYFILARNNATSQNAVYEDVHAGFYDIVVTFMLGYYSRALEALEDKQGVLAIARANGLYSHVTYLEFLRGRVWFELGAYHDAYDAFNQSLNLSLSFPNSAAARLNRRWMARCDVYCQKFAEAEPVFSAESDLLEARFFLAESLLLQEKYDEALVILSGPEFTAVNDNTLHPERIDWHNGFSNLEGKVFLAVNQQDCFTNLALAYKTYCMGKTSQGKGMDAVDILFSFTRNQRRSLQDPYNYLYYFLYSQTLRPVTEGNIDDYSTILGKAVKFIQERSSRIEDPGHKQSYLRSSWWNRLLIQDARGHNLA